ncbi:MAG: DNA repair protein RecN, partial [Mariprofundaceae bacterium]
EPFRELAAIASGGEISRFVLALKGCGALRSAPQVAVFDEVDAGIGGETAWRVGELLAAMGRERQVLVVSHLAQVAACADYHQHINKQEQDGRTIIAIENVEADRRLDELARMLGGVNEQSRSHAADMLKRGQN